MTVGIVLVALGLAGWGLVSLYLEATLVVAVYRIGQVMVPKNGPHPGPFDNVVPGVGEFAPMLLLASAWIWRLGTRLKGPAWGAWAGAAVLLAAGIVGVAFYMTPVLRREVVVELEGWLLWFGTAGLPAGAWILSDLRRRSKSA